MEPANDHIPTVLVVDDDPDLLQVMTDGLQLLGHFRVIQAEDGEQALEQYFADRPDCVVVDVMMPKLNGYQLTRAFRGDPDSAITPLIILTALPQDKDRFAGLASGADQYLVKPVSPRELIQAVQRAIRLGATERLGQMQRLAGGDGHDAHHSPHN